MNSDSPGPAPPAYNYARLTSTAKGRVDINDRPLLPLEPSKSKGGRRDAPMILCALVSAGEGRCASNLATGDRLLPQDHTDLDSEMKY